MVDFIFVAFYANICDVVNVKLKNVVLHLLRFLLPIPQFILSKKMYVQLVLTFGTLLLSTTGEKILDEKILTLDFN